MTTGPRTEADTDVIEQTMSGQDEQGQYGQGPNEETARLLRASLEYEAPFLVEKLLKEKIVESADEAQALFREVKRYFVLVETSRPDVYEMYSLRVDEVWHQFVLFTREYMKFCTHFFGRYLPHSPSNAPIPEGMEHREPRSFEQFGVRYREVFGEPPPDLWRDSTSVTVNRRMVNDYVGVWRLVRNGDVVELGNDHGEVMLAVSAIAAEALAFAVNTGAFYVREMPGDLDDDEKRVLAATLVEYNLLRVAS